MADDSNQIPKITRDDPAAHSGNVIADNIQALRQLFPSIVTDGKIDFEVLRQLLGDSIEDGAERYGLNWKGKSRARAFALTPSLGTLRPAKEESKEWDTTKNIVIEGDNLEVLKLLRKSYAGRVKLIYIDPPYNTGKDFVYPDNYTNSLANYEALTGQRGDDGVRLLSNKENSGRFHTSWLNMIYPRLMLAESLLNDDGAIFVSCDEHEIQNVRFILDESFGPSNFVATLSILSNPKGRSQDKYFASNHDYVVVYSKRSLPKGHFSIDKDEAEIEADYPEEDEGGKFRYLELRNTHREFGRFNRKDLFYPLYVAPDCSVSMSSEEDFIKVLPVWDDGFEGCWTWGKEKAGKETFLLEGRHINGKIKIFRKSYASGADRMLKTILTEKSYITERGQREFNTLFETKAKLFQSPKSPFLIGDLIRTIATENDLVLDFFAGSGTTGHAVMAQNAADGGNRRYILVQLPEPLDPAKSEQKAAADFCDAIGKPRTIAELTKERLRRAGAKVEADNPDAQVDVGFRVYKLATSNLKPWQPGDDLKADLLDATGNILPGRTENDLLVELLLKTGIDLALPDEARRIAGLNVNSLGGGTLIVCLADIPAAKARELGDGIAEWVKALAPPAPTTFFFKDSGFDAGGNRAAEARANLAATLRQRLGDEAIEKLGAI